jgi:hypothetical protein
MNGDDKTTRMMGRWLLFQGSLYRIRVIFIYDTSGGKNISKVV